MPKTFPYLEVQGTHYEIGHAIGETFRGKILEIINERKRDIPEYSSLLLKCQPYYDKTVEVFPHLIDELSGIAEGANVDPMDLFFHNTREVFDHTRAPDREFLETLDHCTIAVSFNPNGAIIGHNEDWAIESIDELYVLKAKIGETTFLGLQYASYIAGGSATLNNYGLSQCINELHQKAVVGVPKYFLSRAICECKTIDEAIGIIEQTPRASGFNHVLVQDNDITDVEIAYGEIDIEKQSGVPYIHTNHCISQRLKQYEEDTKTHHQNSFSRYMKAKELAKLNMNKDDMIALLSDTSDPTYPICRADATIGSVVIEPRQNTMHICYGAPNKGEFLEYRL